MKNKIKLFILPVLLISVLFITESASARRRGGYKRRWRRFSLRRALSSPTLYKQAGITLATRNRALAVFRNLRIRTRAMRKDMRKAYRAIRAEYRKKVISLEGILGRAKYLHNQNWKIRKARIMARVKVLNMLTFAQRTKLKELYRNRRYRGRHHRGPRGHRGRGGM